MSTAVSSDFAQVDLSRGGNCIGRLGRTGRL